MARPRLILAAVALAAVLASCGTPGSLTLAPTTPTLNPLAGKTITGYLTSATSPTTSLRFTAVITERINGTAVTGLTPTQSAALNQTVQIVITGRVESPNRYTVSIGIGSIGITVTEYDGVVYESTNGGVSYRVVPVTAVSGSFSPSDVRALIARLPGGQAVGITQINGVEAEHITAPLTASLLKASIAKSSNAGSTLNAILDTLTIKSGTIDLYVGTGNGLMTEVDETFDCAVDLQAMLRAEGIAGRPDTARLGGVLELSGQIHGTYDYGTTVVIAKPTV